MEYSIDSGATWTTIVSGTSNDGHYSWNVPNQPSTECLIRVSEFGNPSINDVSDVTFNIYPHITVTQPNGGQHLFGCASQTIQWRAGGTSNNYKIEYSLNNGTSWTTLNSNYSSSSTYPSITWNPLPNTNAAQCLVRVTDVSDPTKTDMSDTTFIISQTSNALVAQPNGGEFLVTGTVYPINYTTDGSTNNVRIEYSTNGISSWQNIVSSHSGGTYTWNVPNTPTSTAKIRVTDVNNLSLIHI